MTQQRPRLGEHGSSYTLCANDAATRTSAASHTHHPRAMFMLTLARPPSGQMRRDAELAAALWSQEMRHQQHQQMEQQQQRRTPSAPSATEPVSSTTGRESAASPSSPSSWSQAQIPPSSPSKRGPPWRGNLIDAAAATPPQPPLTHDASGALDHALMDPPSSSSSSPATPVMPGLAGIGSVLFNLLGRTPPASREDEATAAAADPGLPRSLPRTPQQGITSSPAVRTLATLAGTPTEAGSPAPYMRPMSEREIESIQGCSAAIARWPGGSAVLVEAGRMAQSFIRVHRQRMADMSAKRSAVLLAWQRTLNVVVENLLKQLLTVALAQQPLRNKLAVVTAKEGERPHLIDAHLVSQLRQCLEAVRYPTSLTPCPTASHTPPPIHHDKPDPLSLTTASMKLLVDICSATLSTQRCHVQCWFDATGTRVATPSATTLVFPLR
jgi:hypothetical protein